METAMGKPNPEAVMERKEKAVREAEARAAAAAIRMGVERDADDAADDDEDEEQEAVVTGTDGMQRRVRIRQKRKNGAKMKRFIKGLKAQFKALEDVNTAQDEKIEAIRTELKSYLDQFHGETAAAQSQALGMWSQFKPLISVGLSLINQADKVQYPAMLTLAVSLEQMALSQQYKDSAFSVDFLTTGATLARAFAYYDAKIGLASIWSADAANAAASTTPRVYA